MPLNVSSPYGAGGAPQFRPRACLSNSPSSRAAFPKTILPRVWTLADIDDRGKLNLADSMSPWASSIASSTENEIPDKLPPELEPPSFQATRRVGRTWSETSSNTRPGRALPTPTGLCRTRPNRSFTENTNGNSDPTRDANRLPAPDSASRVTSRARGHVDRDAVRRDVRTWTRRRGPQRHEAPAREHRRDARPPSRTRTASRTAEDEALEREMEDLNYRVKRLNEDLDYASRPPRTAAKDDERAARARAARADAFGTATATTTATARGAMTTIGRGHTRAGPTGGTIGISMVGATAGARRRLGGTAMNRDRRDYDRPRSTAPHDYERPRSTAPPVPDLPQSRPAPTPSSRADEEHDAPRAHGVRPRGGEAPRRRTYGRARCHAVPRRPARSRQQYRERLAQEKREAEEKARIASQQAEEREAARRDRLAS
ncbi:hypothetical protein B0H14DRAFT_3736964 [Mycena olivaceomarginata]|nr:hypothetical protein B0H14DRAFT_3736964 [Mycena olivaceomarginata]